MDRDRSMASVGYSTKELTNLLCTKDQNASMPTMLLDPTDSDGHNINASVDIPTLPESHNDTFDELSYPSSLSSQAQHSLFESRLNEKLKSPRAIQLDSARQIIAKTRPTALRAKID